jgi:hypothetical protein
MANKIIVLFLIPIVLFSSNTTLCTEKENIKDKIIQAVDIWFNPGPSVKMENMLDSLFQLLDIAGSITTAVEYKEDINYRIDVAKELFKEDSIFNEKARQYLSFAYRMMTNGKKYQKPEDLDVFVTPDEAQQKAVKYAKNLIEKALSELDAGHPGETAILLLEMVLMIVSPIEGEDFLL